MEMINIYDCLSYTYLNNKYVSGKVSILNLSKTEWLPSYITAAQSEGTLLQIWEHSPMGLLSSDNEFVAITFALIASSSVNIQHQIHNNYSND